MKLHLVFFLLIVSYSSYSNYWWGYQPSVSFCCFETPDYLMLITWHLDVTLSKALKLCNQMLSNFFSRETSTLGNWLQITRNYSEIFANNVFETPLCFLSPDQPLVKVLGLQWLPSIDWFTYKISLLDTSVIPTKRALLSTISRIFDPCGLLSSVVFYELWTLGINWDFHLPDEIIGNWNNFIQTLPRLQKLSLNRPSKNTGAW